MTKPKVKIIPRGGIAFVTHGHLHTAAVAAKQQLKTRGVSGIEIQKLDVVRFPSGEVKPRIKENVRGKDIFFFFGFTQRVELQTLTNFLEHILHDLLGVADLLLTQAAALITSVGYGVKSDDCN